MPTPTFKILFARAIGGAGAIMLMIELAAASGAPLMWIPFATSIVMIMGSPDAPPAQPHCLLGGHIICAATGVVCTLIIGPEMWVAAVAIGLAILGMHLADAFHPPAGISPLIIAASNATPVYILTPVLTGALILLAYAFVFHRLSGDKWP